MWYYSKDGKEKTGPIADPAMSVLISRGEITKDTKVWSPKQKEWCPLWQSEIYKKTKQKKKSEHLLQLERYTYIFRAFLISFFVCMLFSISFYYDSVCVYREYLDNGDVLDKASKTIQAYEISQTKRLISLILLVMLAVTAYFGYRWVKTVVINAKMLKRRISYTPTFSAWSFALPFVNLIIPKQVVTEVLVISLSYLKSARKIPYIVLGFTWYVFWCSSNIMLITSLIITPTNCEPDQFMPIYLAKILFLSTYAVTIFLTMTIVSVIFSLQKKCIHPTSWNSTKNLNLQIRDDGRLG